MYTVTCCVASESQCVSGDEHSGFVFNRVICKPSFTRYTSCGPCSNNKSDVIFFPTGTQSAGEKPTAAWSPSGSALPSCYYVLFSATFTRQRCAELPHPWRGAGGEGRPAHRVGVVSLEQSPPLSGAGELAEPAAGLVLSGRPGDGPQRRALTSELWVLRLGGCGKPTKHPHTKTQSMSKCDAEATQDFTQWLCRLTSKQLSVR